MQLNITVQPFCLVQHEGCLMPANMTAEAHCQEERGINEEAWLCASGMVALKARTGGSTGAGIIMQ